MKNETYSVVMIKCVYLPDYQGQGRPVIVRDNNGEEITGLTLEESREKVKELENEIYCTSNGDAGRPEYCILEDGYADYYTNGRNQDGSNYGWTNWEQSCKSPRNGEVCGECYGCQQLMINEDISGVRSSKKN